MNLESLERYSPIGPIDIQVRSSENKTKVLGTFGNFDRRVLRRNQFIDIRGEVQVEWDYYNEEITFLEIQSASEAEVLALLHALNVPDYHETIRDQRRAAMIFRFPVLLADLQQAEELFDMDDFEPIKHSESYFTPEQMAAPVIDESLLRSPPPRHPVPMALPMNFQPEPPSSETVLSMSRIAEMARNIRAKGISPTSLNSLFKIGDA